MDRLYYVADDGTIDPTPLVVGGSYHLPPSDPDAPVAYNVQHNPSIGLYLAIRDTDPLPPYHDQEPDTLTLVGDLGDEATRVQETRNYVLWHIDRIYDAKESEIALADEDYRYAVADSSLSANWWIMVTANGRAEHNSVAAARTFGQPWAGGPNAPRLGIYNAVNGRVRREQIGAEADWATSMTDVALHDQAVGDATHASGTALDAAYATGDPLQVAAHDPYDPAWGYPTLPIMGSALN